MEAVRKCGDGFLERCEPSGQIGRERDMSESKHTPKAKGTEALLQEMSEALEAATNILTSPGIMNAVKDVDEWDAWKQQVERQIHAALRKAKGEG